MEQVTGLLFGHYLDDISPLLFEVLVSLVKSIVFHLLIVMILVMEPTMQSFLLEEGRF